MSSLAARYRGYADLAAHQAEGTDYKIHVRKAALLLVRRRRLDS